METVPRTRSIRKPRLHKLRHVLNLILPVLERQVNVIAQMVNHCLSSIHIAHHSHSLFSQFLNSVLYLVQFLSQQKFLVFSMESNHSLKDFLVSKTHRFAFEFGLNFRNLFFYFSVALLH